MTMLRYCWLVSFLMAATSAFVVVERRVPASPASTQALHALPAHVAQLFDAASSSLILTAAADEVAFDGAFQDSISLTDGPIKIMLAVFVVVMGGLLGLTFLSGKVDEAIYETLTDMEATLKKYHPKRWERMEAELDGLVEEARDIKLLAMMEEMQEKEPEFMTKLRKQMDF
jgi:hypothetical protein